MNNHRMISDDEARALLAGYLGTFADYCEARGLRYFLCGGTLLGAVRHHGFIPWDDDIDVMMPRPDYEAFIRLAEKEPVGAPLKLMGPQNDKNYLWPFIKLADTRTALVELQYRRRHRRWMRERYGLYIDIFPIDGLPDSKEGQAQYFTEIKRHTRDLQRSAYHLGGVRPLPRLLFRAITHPYYVLMGHRRFLRRLDALARSHEYGGSRNVAAVFGSYGIREVMEKECVASAVKVTFEAREYNAPAGYDRYLGSLYGDYMKLPPEEKRVTHHLRELYWRN